MIVHIFLSIVKKERVKSSFQKNDFSHSSILSLSKRDRQAL
ncbi:hypothetical protein SanJ4211_0484c [Streptococcus anginosus]|nr:hypothetical protein SanJ4211_0484c [Streptococcus anginosus]